MTEIASLLPVAREAVALARRIVRNRAPLSVRSKGERDMVTDVDLAVEDAVREFLAKETPDVRVLGEEQGDGGARCDGDPADRLWWALDPVDGTANLARGIPLCGVSLGLVAGRRSVLAAIDLPFLEVTYTAVDGLGAHVGDRPLRASPVRELSDAVISVGDFAVGAGAAAKNRVRLELMGSLGAMAQRIRMLGSAAIDLAWVAHGKLDATVILANLPWDTMAGTVLVREAGGVVLDQDGTDHSADSSATIAVCPGLRGQIMSALAQARHRAS